jgi:hypothetical protein
MNKTNEDIKDVYAALFAVSMGMEVFKSMLDNHIEMMKRQGLYKYEVKRDLVSIISKADNYVRDFNRFHKKRMTEGEWAIMCEQLDLIVEKHVERLTKDIHEYLDESITVI